MSLASLLPEGTSPSVGIAMDEDVDSAIVTYEVEKPGKEVIERIEGVTVKQLLGNPKTVKAMTPVMYDILQRYQLGLLPKCSDEEAAAMLQRYLNGEPEPEHERNFHDDTGTDTDKSVQQLCKRSRQIEE